MKRNCIIGQSGGPTIAINASLAGIIHRAKSSEEFDNVYGMINGIKGLLEGRYMNLLEEFDDGDKINALKQTPAMYLGSCRYKLPTFQDDEDTYVKLFKILKELEITDFFYIGGNDSMDTTAKLSAYAKKTGIDIKFIGIPKTIDNDLMYTDHTPGFGSAAKFIATSVLETYLDSSVYINNGIFILETMGRDTGWLASAAALAQLNGKQVADFIYLPETAFDIDKFLIDVKNKFEEQNQVYIVVSEGIRTAEGKFVAKAHAQAHDKFGHAQLGGVGNYLKNLIISSGITSRVKSLELGVLQRCAMHCASNIDIEEAYEVGYEALRQASLGKCGYMIGIKRESNTPYKSSYFLIEADKVANNVKYFPTEWINEEGNNLKAEVLEYLSPLVSSVPSVISSLPMPVFKVFNK